MWKRGGGKGERRSTWSDNLEWAERTGLLGRGRH